MSETILLARACVPKDLKGAGVVFSDSYIEVECQDDGYKITVKKDARVIQAERWVLVTFQGTARMRPLAGIYVYRTKGLVIRRYGNDRQYLVAFR